MKASQPPKERLDFKELPVDGQKFEQLARELMFGLGLHARWSGKGPDGGRDLICDETVASTITPQRRTWLVQCKHFAHSGKSVGIADIDNIIDSCSQHNATGYLLFCSTQPSSGLVARLEQITADRANPITATYWDDVAIERLLSVPRLWAIAQRFMPASCGSWKIFATESPSRFVAHYKGYVFHLTNRIGSNADHHLPSVAARISDIEAIQLPEHHFIRPRSVYYDDKGASYTWYIDYMIPQGEKPHMSNAQIMNTLHDGWALEDGQIYTWDVKTVEYFPYSDHHDEDHDDYYAMYLPNFVEGRRRNDHDWNEYYATKQEIENLEQATKEIRESSFKGLVETLKKVSFLRIMRAVNAGPEDVSKFGHRFAWPDLSFQLGRDMENLFTSVITLQVLDDAKWHDLLLKLPQTIEAHFRVGRVEVYTPEGRADEPGQYIYDLRLSILPPEMTDQYSTRVNFNKYFDELRQSIEDFIAEFT